MYKKRVEKLHDKGVISDEEYADILRCGFNDKGRVNPGVRPALLGTKYALGLDPNNINLLEEVRHLTPWLGADTDIPELFGKYGVTYCGICDGWRWFTPDNLTEWAIANGKKPLESATELELWQMLALSSLYWYNSYREWYYNK